VDGEKTNSLFPFYYSTKNDNGEKTNSYLFYFFNSHKRKIANSNQFYQEKRIFWFIRYLSNYKALKEKGLM